jgi:glycerophosphoryl diester phosphodiesterase
MNANGGRPLRIAHAYGNRRDKIEAATTADIDFIEADLWYRAGEVWVRHERRLGFLPLLFDQRPQGIDSAGPWALTVFPGHYIRLDVDPLRLGELLERTAGTRRLLLDLKGNPSGDAARAYADTLTKILAQAECEQSVIVCGQTDVLDDVRKAAPHLDVRHSIEKQQQWDRFLRRLEADPDLRGVCLHHGLLSDERAQFLKGKGLQVFCWTVDDAADARRLVGLGADGIISNSIPLLEQLGSD